MKKNLSYLFFMLLLFTFSCSSDDDSSEGDSGINAQNLVISFNENPSAGDSIGTIQAISANTLNFSITSQTPSGALTINPATGELTVANAALFDFETNPVISAAISIIDLNNSADVTATINVTNLDDIASFLSTSKTAYTATSDGDWVQITEAEYNTLANSLNLVTKVATSDADYNSTEANVEATTNVTVANDNGVTMPNGSYLFAFKYNAHINTITTAKVKQSSTSVSDGYMDVGAILPSHDAGDNYFVLKGSNTPTTNQGYLATYANGSINYKNILGNDNAIGTGDTNTLTTNQEQATLLYQGLSSTQKQW